MELRMNFQEYVCVRVCVCGEEHSLANIFAGSKNNY